MSSHVGIIVVRGFPPEKEVIVEEPSGQPSSSAVDPNFPFEQCKPRCMLLLSYPSSLSFDAYNLLRTYV
jgi:hypothetical protein